ncbi:peptidoglycan D,D-transpeptidase FtsI family protein [Ruicaihuangia caeni]|uniref:Penicillin-binding transpeptidase domain-containing protein n=1 Tax=Ruicaihuangia caeni TaxID=3042517 RepID=A0AAW6TB01_9MICO|nr:penicillin-binding transpeptidase domain-containing protein [Klugiella sp. YN-L-19]MDI2099158.1 penicillin-binding transpeptidase domain-containing protein [Klugiella sp. YN-L-19]
MTRELRRLSIAVLIMFLALFTSTTIIQVVQADELRNDPRNARTLYSSYSAERGPILVDGTPIAQSVPDDSQYKFQRVYPSPELYAPITGYFTLNQGNSGLEGALNDYLTGTSNAQFLDQITAIFTGQNPKGASVETTIDPVVQQAAWDALGDQSGAIIAIEPSSGAILAMVSKPSYDPNALAQHDTSAVIQTYQALNADPANPLYNRTIGGNLYHPGSVFKVLMAAAAIDSGEFAPETQIPNPPQLQLPQSSSIVTNAGGSLCGGGETVSLADALRLSCNIPFAQVGAQLGEATISDYAKAFGFGESLEIPMSTTASVYPSDMDQAHLMLSSFGQGDDRVTPLQIAMISAAIANGGTLMVPTLVESINAPDLSEIKGPSAEVYSQPVTAQTAELVKQMMVAGVSNGAASNARIDGVDVAGKTGTAENGEGEPYTLWFTGFAPADDPKVAVAVVVENGGGRGQNAFGNQIAAPIAKRVLEAVLSR